jgi:hypothetical protein
MQARTIAVVQVRTWFAVGTFGKGGILWVPTLQLHTDRSVDVVLKLIANFDLGDRSLCYAHIFAVSDNAAPVCTA